MFCRTIFSLFEEINTKFEFFEGGLNTIYFRFWNTGFGITDVKWCFPEPNDVTNDVK